MRFRFFLLIVIVILLMLLLSGPVWPGASAAFAAPVTLDCPTPGDGDCDGVLDGGDNCPLVYNPDQGDLDRDGMGDACDLCPEDSWNDYDHDGICAPPDNCPDVVNPLQEDTDGDGEGDRCDLDDGLILIDLAGGASMNFQEEWGCSGFNLYRGSLADLRASGIYTQEVGAGSLAMARCGFAFSPATDDTLLPAGASVFYLMTCTQGGIEGSLGTDGGGQMRPNDHACTACDRHFTTVFRRSISGVGTRQDRVISNRTDWCAFWPEECDSPLIDFPQEVAVVSALGGQRDSCHDTAITCIRGTAVPEGIDVTVSELVPGTCACLAVMTSPLHVVKIPGPVTGAAFQHSTSPLCP